MTASDEVLSVEEFRVRAAQAGLVLEEREVDAMYEGYLGLQGLLARLPQGSAFADEPASVFMASATRVAR